MCLFIAKQPKHFIAKVDATKTGISSIHLYIQLPCKRKHIKILSNEVVLAIIINHCSLTGVKKLNATTQHPSISQQAQQMARQHKYEQSEIDLRYNFSFCFYFCSKNKFSMKIELLIEQKLMDKKELQIYVYITSFQSVMCDVKCNGNK